ncbi:MAG: hypothetical protein GEV28_21515 [Actinophytocola sp.]|uniref:hypothetical protein n=1 Tax=Actinophytocola sp. TaxID=1872138 RepID=UPI0013225F15|nr:hypothetical protein [Actinophytocola sp.]MPZ82834.1 hypothetical protein [Actinophytocola sp.]
MRALFIATLAAAAVVGLAGCGQDAAPAGDSAGAAPDTASSTATSTELPSLPPVSKPQDPPAPKPTEGTPEPPVSVSPSGVVVPEGVRQVPAGQVDASALPVYYEHRGEVWVFDDDYSLQMFAAASSGCTDAEAVVVDQSASEVRIMLRPLDQPQGGRPDGTVCTAVMTPRPVTVRLDAPLGDRKIFLAGGR